MACVLDQIGSTADLPSDQKVEKASSPHSFAVRPNKLIVPNNWILFASNAISRALQVAVMIENTVYRAVQTVASNPVGVYRGPFLQFADDREADMHSRVGYLEMKNLSFT
jgi:hypothetical protein